ncbi:MAG: TatD family hydrolase [Candidatus Omnitrophota bacterium]
MRIDFHTHAFPDNISRDAVKALSQDGKIPSFSDGTLSGLMRSMDAAGIDISVVLNIATKPSQTRNIIDWCLKIKSDRIIPFASIHPSNSDYEDIIARIKGEGLKGIKLHPMYQDFEADDEKMFPLYERISASGLIVIFHSGKDIAFPDDDRADVGRILSVREKFRELKMVAAHTGGWRSWKEVYEKLAGKDIYFDISMTSGYIESAELFHDIIRKHSPDRLLFGTDSPWADQKKEAAWVESLDMDREAKDKIKFKNALELLS